MKHFPPPYLQNPQHRITIDLIGLGGTGSQVLTGLARINASLLMLNHPGLHVRSWDPDEVTEANLGRQLLSESDLGMNKAVVLTTRVNRYFGFEWEAMPTKYPTSPLETPRLSNIIITCVDTIRTRIIIGDYLKEESKLKGVEPFDKPLYWLDIGNLHKTGQLVLGTVSTISQPKGSGASSSLPTVVKKFPQLKKMKEDASTPSCSLADALGKQDLFINSTLAQFACGLLWKLFREPYITQHGCYVNLDSFIVTPIKIN